MFFLQAEDGIRDRDVTGVQTCALPICNPPRRPVARSVTVYRTTKVDNVDALLLSNQDSVFGTVGQSHRLVPVAQIGRASCREGVINAVHVALWWSDDSTRVSAVHL